MGQVVADHESRSVVLKKKIEYCDFCKEETLHRYKRQSWYKGGQDKRHMTIQLPVKCFKCGSHIGSRVKKEKRQKHISIE